MIAPDVNVLLYARRDYSERHDIIATTGNPLADIRTLKRVTFVMKNGKVVKHEK